MSWLSSVRQGTSAPHQTTCHNLWATRGDAGAVLDAAADSGRPAAVDRRPREPRPWCHPRPRAERRPRHPGLRPHVVKVASPLRDVSRNHLEVILEGWHVMVRDLGTTNGTTVTLPWSRPVQLVGHDQQVLEPGAIVALADEVTFTYDVGRVDSLRRSRAWSTSNRSARAGMPMSTTSNKARGCRSPSRSSRPGR